MHTGHIWVRPQRTGNPVECIENGTRIGLTRVEQRFEVPGGLMKIEDEGVRGGLHGGFA